MTSSPPRHEHPAGSGPGQHRDGQARDEAPASAGGPLMLCPGCCTIGDIPEWTPTAEVLTPLAGCTRCGFLFPILPGDFAQLTLDAMCHHECTGFHTGNWSALGQAIVDAIHHSAITGADLAERLDGLWPADAPVRLE